MTNNNYLATLKLTKLKGVNSMTNKDITTLIYNYHDQATANIMIKWATEYATNNDVSLEYGLVAVLLNIHHKGVKQ